MYWCIWYPSLAYSQNFRSDFPFLFVFVFVSGIIINRCLKNNYLSNHLFCVEVYTLFKNYKRS